MRLQAVAALLMLIPGPPQGLLPEAKPQHATIAASASAAAAAPGSKVTLWVDVVPNRSIHIYARGAKGFTPVSVSVRPPRSMTAGTPVYPKPDMASSPGELDAVPAYTTPFRIAVPLTIRPAARRGDRITIGGTLEYQACDDRLCYPVTSAPLSWTLAVK